MREEQLQEEQCIWPHGIVVEVRGISLVDKLGENVVWGNMPCCCLFVTLKESFEGEGVDTGILYVIVLAVLKLAL